TLRYSSSTYANDYTLLYYDALDAADANGYNTDSYDIVGVVMPYVYTGWIGLGTVGGSRHWINGNQDAEVYVHEFGHNYGLRHASSWDANNGSVIPPPSQANSSTYHSEYGDIFDVMGNGPVDGDYSAFGKRRLNWITSSHVREIKTAGRHTVRINRFDHPSSDNNTTLAVRVLYGQSEPYWIAHRRAFTSNDSLSNGAHIVWEYETTRGRLLDMTPDSSVSDYYDKVDSALPIGQTFTDPTGQIQITPLECGGFGSSEWLEVEIFIGTSTNRNPIASLPVISDLTVGVAQDFQAIASDPDGDPLTYSWKFGDGQTATGNPASHTYTAGGSYLLSVTVDDGNGGTATASRVVTVSEVILGWQQVYSGVDSVFYDLIFHEGRFLATGSSYLLHSLDGITWTKSLLGAFSGRGIAADGETIRVVGDYFNGVDWEGGVAVSEGGFEWSIESLPSDLPRLNAIASGNNRWVAVGEQGLIVRRDEAGDWHEVTPRLTDRRFNAIVFYSGAFYAGGDNNTLYRSANGLNWTDVSSLSRFADGEDIEDMSIFASSLYLAGENFSVSHNGGAAFLPLTAATNDYPFLRNRIGI
ncbi:MAG: PKD domain-containing protein, partial [Puniceicoccales bacterium]